MYTAAFIYQAKTYDQEFFDLNQIIDEIAKANAGFLGSESWVSSDGLSRNATYYWANLESLQEFSKHPKHLEAKRQYQRWYKGFQVVISEVIRSYSDGTMAHHSQKVA